MIKKPLRIGLATLVLVSGLLVINPPDAAAANCFSTASGNWSNPAIWSCGHVPLAGDGARISNGDTVTLDTTGVAGDLRIFANGTLTVGGSNTLSVSGHWTNSGTFIAGTGTVIFNGGTAQDLTLNVPTSFHNLVIGTLTILLETGAADNATVNGSLTNDGIIRKAQLVTGTGPLTFGLTGVGINVTNPGTLSNLQVDRRDTDHPAAVPSLQTGRYWTISPTGSGFMADLTLPHSVVPDTAAQACRYTGSDTIWECGRTASTPSTVTRAGVTQLSDWAVGNNPPVDLALAKSSSPNPVQAGATLTYTLSISNAGPGSANSILVTDTLPAGTTFVSASNPGGTCGQAGGVVTCTVASLAVGPAVDVSVVVTAPGSGPLMNTATVGSAATDPDTSNNSASASTTVLLIADLSLIKTDGQITATAGSSISYTIVVTNAGPSPVASAMVSDVVPGTITAVTWTCLATAGSTCTPSGSGNTLSDLASLASGGMVTYTVEGTIALSAVGAVVSNTAAVSVPLDVSDPVPGNNTATDSTAVTVAKLYLPLVLRSP